MAARPLVMAERCWSRAAGVAATSARALAQGTEPSAAAAPHAYRVRGGGMVAGADVSVADALLARFGDPAGRVAAD